MTHRKSKSEAGNGANLAPRWFALVTAILLAGCYSDLQQQPPPVVPVKEAKKPPPERKKRPPPEYARRRRFLFNYETAVAGLKPGTVARIWVPLAETSTYQEVNLVTSTPSNLNVQIDEEGNRFFYYEGTADDEGRIPMKLIYSVVRTETLPLDGKKLTFDDRKLAIRPGTIPGVEKCIEQVLKGQTPLGEPTDVARKVFDATLAHIVGKEKPATGPWGEGDAGWVCEVKTGDSVDLHSVFVALCRSIGLPARIEFGFVLPRNRNEGEIYGYRAWAWYAGERWNGVDMLDARESETPEQLSYLFGHLSPDRVAFTTGRDLKLTPAPAAEKVNFVVYPYVEVNDKPYTNFEHHFSYAPIEEPTDEGESRRAPGVE